MFLEKDPFVYLRGKKIILLTKTCRTRVDKKRIEKTATNRPVASQYASTAMLHTPTHHQRLQENMLLWLFVILILNVRLECFATLVTKLQPRIKIKSHSRNEKNEVNKNDK